MFAVDSQRYVMCNAYLISGCVELAAFAIQHNKTALLETREQTNTVQLFLFEIKELVATLLLF